MDKAKMLFEVYREFSKNQKSQSIGKANLIQTHYGVVILFKQYTKKLLEEVNFTFSESKEPYVLQVFSDREKGVAMVFINTLLSNGGYKKYTKREYETYLSIFGAFGVLLNDNFKIENLEDNKNLHSYKLNFYKDKVNEIFYDENFNLNLIGDVPKNEPEIKVVCEYGYRLVKCLMNEFFKNTFTQGKIMQFLEIKKAYIFKRLLEVFKIELQIKG